MVEGALLAECASSVRLKETPCMATGLRHQPMLATRQSAQGTTVAVPTTTLEQIKPIFEASPRVVLSYYLSIFSHTLD